MTSQEVMGSGSGSFLAKSVFSALPPPPLSWFSFAAMISTMAKSDSERKAFVSSPSSLLQGCQSGNMRPELQRP